MSSYRIVQVERFREEINMVVGDIEATADGWWCTSAHTWPRSVEEVGLL